MFLRLSRERTCTRTALLPDMLVFTVAANSKRIVRVANI